MASRIAAAPREKVYGPPKDWKRPAIPTAVKIAVVVLQRGIDPVSGAVLDPIGRGVDFDHTPPLQQRCFDFDAWDTVPPANSIEHIVARDRPQHREKTAKRDVPEIYKTRRLEKGPKKRRGRAIQNRPFQKRKERP